MIPAGFRRHVAAALPGAEQIVLQDCGHAPQVERAEQTAGMLCRLFDRHEALRSGRFARLPSRAA
jgi:pimeloyl-ACP methyl ester carboxylesterase